MVKTGAKDVAKSAGISMGSAGVGLCPNSTSRRNEPPGTNTRAISDIAVARSSTWSREFRLLTTSNDPSAKLRCSTGSATYSMA